MDDQDYYAILGVPRRATADEIKRAYRKLAREFHPDVSKDKSAAEERFKRVNEAYDVLGDPAKRRVYDEGGLPGNMGGRRPGPGSGAGAGPFRRGRPRPGSSQDPFSGFGGGPSDGSGLGGIFERIFGGGGGGGAGSFAGAARGEDVESEITVSLDEVLKGSVRSITERHEDPETGREHRTTFQVRIPPGVKEGQMIRVPGRGSRGAGRTPGDLYLRVRYEAHPHLTVREQDLSTEVVLAPWEAVLGTTVTVNTLDGAVAVKIAPGSRSGQRLRVRGRGLPVAESGRGDFFVVLRVDVPPEVSAEEKALWERLAAVSTFRPRE